MNYAPHKIVCSGVTGVGIACKLTSCEHHEPHDRFDNCGTLGHCIDRPSDYQSKVRCISANKKDKRVYKGDKIPAPQCPECGVRHKNRRTAVYCLNKRIRQDEKSCTGRRFQPSKRLIEMRKYIENFTNR